MNKTERRGRSKGVGMPCPECKSFKTVVSDSRMTSGQRGPIYRSRRYCCIDCQHRFSTQEHPVDAPPPPSVLQQIRGSVADLLTEIDDAL